MDYTAYENAVAAADLIHKALRQIAVTDEDLKLFGEYKCTNKVLYSSGCLVFMIILHVDHIVGTVVNE